MTELETLLAEAVKKQGPIVFLTGAGISAESGIPTFRGKDGFWTVGSKEYRPEELATFATFRAQPKEVWDWYLYRREKCIDAKPNPAHYALVDIEKKWGDRFRLITQNVDGLHLAAGNSPERTWGIHGNINFMRCSETCTRETLSLPPKEPDLHCPSCGAWMRPHVLWFDEYYDEAWYRFDSSLAAATEAAVLIVVGTSGATNLPMQVGMRAAEQGACLVDVNPEANPFSELAKRCENGIAITGKAAECLPRIAKVLLDLAT